MPQRSWRPALGACPDEGGTRFRVWAPTHGRVELLVDPDGPASRRHLLTAEDGGFFSGVLDDVKPGAVYKYVLDGKGPYPDPVSRYQPAGVHGPSAVVDPGAFAWSDAGWRGVTLDRAVFYELHVGTFTPEGTFAAAAARLPYLKDLGITVVELMPVADFAGDRNWGYDGVCLFAPSRAYGAPDDLRRLVDAAHALGLAVVLDVVYNHFGPDGAYLSVFSPYYFTERHHTPWGNAVNLDGEHAPAVRAFYIENALHWLHEYHVDGFRFDATHALVDQSPRHLIAELAARVRADAGERAVICVAEDDRNLAAIVRPAEQGGWGLDAVWADDFHHHVRRLSAGDRDGYYQDFSGSVADLAATIRQGWFYTGQHAPYHGGPRGTDPAGLPLESRVFCIQNHDQIGNRPFGERLNHQVDAGLFRALSAVLLFAPETPLLFMGQEWAADTPFQYFTDHHRELGRQVTEGRRSEFSRFEGFADPVMRERIPDPQAGSTFESSRLQWHEATRQPHAGTLELYRALLRLRAAEPALRSGACDVGPAGDVGVVLQRGAVPGPTFLCVAALTGGGRVELPGAGGRWSIVLSTEEAHFGDDGPPGAAVDPAGPAIAFDRPAAVILRRA